MQKGCGQAVRTLRDGGGGAAGRHAGHRPGDGGAAGADGGLRPALPGGEGAAQRHGFLRSGALRRAAAEPSGRHAYGAGRAGVPALPGDHGGRVSGHQRGAELHLPRRVAAGREHLRRGRREAEHLPLPVGRAGDLPGEIQDVRPGGAGCAGSAPADGAQPQFPLPPGGAGRHELRVRRHHVTGDGRAGLYGGAAAASGRGLSRGGGARDGVPLSQRGGHAGAAVRQSGGGGAVRGAAGAAAAGGKIPGARCGRGHAAGGAGGHRDPHAFARFPDGGVLRRAGAGGHPLRRRRERGLFRRHGDRGGAVAAGGGGQSPAGRAADRSAALAAGGHERRPAGGHTRRAAGGGLLRGAAAGAGGRRAGVPDAAG